MKPQKGCYRNPNNAGEEIPAFPLDNHYLAIQCYQSNTTLSIISNITSGLFPGTEYKTLDNG